MQPNTKIDFEAILHNKYVQISAVIFVIVNVLFLNLFVFVFSKPSPSLIASSQQNSASITSPQASDNQSSCASCEAQIEELLTKIKKIEASLSTTPKPAQTASAPTATITTVPTPSPTPTPTTTITNTPTPTTTVGGVKEYYVPFGSGSTTGSDWTDVGGLQTSIDTTLYPTIKTATFEVGGHTPTGNQTVWVRLYNATDNYPISNSEVTWAGGGNQFIISSPITLTSGNKTYKVQMKTQLSYTSYVDSAKVHLILY